MTQITYLAVFIRLFSVFLFLYSLRQLGTVIEFVLFGTYGGLGATILVPILSSVPWLVTSIVLWFFPTVISKKIIGSSDDQVEGSLSAKSLLSVLLSGLSVYFLYYALVDSIYWFSYWRLLPQQAEMGYPTTMSADSIANVYATIFEVVASLCILLNSKKLAGSIRNFGG
ncbi:hypothetical protein [Agaribacterium sp. ZY112]|uniref:hypothetical protein n=1 Tax=Agaribacterium sp. ZY112 TaxID=3233574 RepID=UPI0035252B2E